MEAQELQDRIASFQSWSYQFEFDGGIRTPLADPDRVNRQVQRRRYFFEALLSACGGSLQGKRVLDLGCSSGFWSLQAIEAGADFVLGLDARASSLEQARLVFEAKGVEQSRYSFQETNLFDFELSERFDVVLCLGLLNVVAKPVALFELMSSSGAELIVLDTGLSRSPYRVFEIGRLGEPQNAVDYRFVLVPTRQAVVQLAGQFGYTAHPLARNIADYTHMEDYRSRRRLAFICHRGTLPAALPAEPELHRNFWVSGLQEARARISERMGR